MKKYVIGVLFLMSLTPFNIFSINAQKPVKPNREMRRPNLSDTLRADSTHRQAVVAIVDDSIAVDAATDSLTVTPVDTIAMVNTAQMEQLFAPGTVTDSLPDQSRKVFVPDPTKAVWYSALCPGLGQIYNRRFWKLPIVIGGFMGLGYGASWNNSMLSDYTRAYYDLMDNDPSTKSYMDFFPPTTSEDSLNKTWLERVLKSRKDYFRRNRDLCIISMVGVYLIAMVDAYVDASLTNFDISPDLSLNIYPTLLRDNLSRYPAPGVQWAFTF